MYVGVKDAVIYDRQLRTRVVHLYFSMKDARNIGGDAGQEETSTTAQPPSVVYPRTMLKGRVICNRV